jgi:CubicO group peptidase (beta-lactamase class C family)
MPTYRFALIAAALSVPLLAGGVPTGTAEDSGMSTARLARVHESIVRHVEAGEISGAVTLVARRGRIVHLEAHGLMDIESKRPMEKDAIFRLASMTKPITSVAVMMMVEEGKIRLSDPISKFLPEFKEMKVSVQLPGSTMEKPKYYTIPAEREITVLDCLTHTSGIVTWQALSNRLAPRREPGDTLATYVPKLAAVPLDFQPGSQWSYSGGAAPDVLGRIVEIVSGQSYDRYLRTRLFEPLGMKDTFFFPPQDRRQRMVTLYRKGEKGLDRAPNQDGFSTPNYFSAGGGLMSTAEDYLQFAQMLLNGGALNGKRFLGTRTVELMASNHVGDMFNGKLGRPAHGMGFGLLMAVIQDHVAAGLAVSNGAFGWDGAFGTQTWIDPKEQMVEIVMIQTQVAAVQRDFEGAVRQAIVE